MNILTEKLLAKIDQLTAVADKLRDGDPHHSQLIEQIAALNAAVTQHDED